MQGGGGLLESGIDPTRDDSGAADGSMGFRTKNSTFQTMTQGNKGGIGAAPNAGAGGGGKGAVGGDGSGTTGGNGGAGTDVSTFIGGSALFKAAGGGGSGSVTAELAVHHSVQAVHSVELTQHRQRLTQHQVVVVLVTVGLLVLAAAVLFM
jgi:hypothetical protein